MLRMLILICALAAVPAVSMAQPSVAPRTQADIKVSFADVVKKVSPAVVNIYAQKVVQSQVTPFAADPFFQMFFGEQAFPGVNREQVERSLGSGVIVRPDGLLVTNEHVVRGAQDIRIVLHDKREFSAKLIASDTMLDIAVLQIDLGTTRQLPFAEFGNSDTLEVGDVVLAIGNPFGVGQSVSMGIVSALGRTNVSDSSAANFIQTDAAINPGNSGGALVNSVGRVVGINSAIFTRSGGSNGIGFATPSNAVRAIIGSVLATGQVQHAWLGASGQDVTPVLAEKLGLSVPSGVLLNEVVPNSPATRAGLQVGDIILTVDSFEVADMKALNARIAAMPVDGHAELKIWREGAARNVVVQLAPLPERKPEDTRQVLGPNPLNGFVVENITPALAQEFRLPLNTHGVMVTGAPNQTLGLRLGDILLAINRRDIQNLKDLDTALDTRPRTWEIVYRRGSRVFRLFLQ